MRIVLLYPPPWKIAAPGEPIDRSGDGPPSDHQPTDIDADFWQMPYGLLSLAAQGLRAGHQVKLFNLSAFAWSQVQAVIRQLDADLWGLSCFTANRRGVELVSRAIRRHHSNARIVVGGPHATALGREILEHWPAVDGVVLGEGEQSFAELVARLEAGASPSGIAGTVWRDRDGALFGPARSRIRDLDALCSPHDYFPCHVLLTARGCPGRCTFCATRSVWGHELRAHSVGYVLDTLEKALARLPVAMITFKDETFTAQPSRGLALCQGILERGLNFVWSCDTRADSLSAELVRAMRLAGCQRLSLGVESGSPTILRNIRKQVAPDAVLRATELCRSVGLQVRYFLMLGNRGETAQSLRETVAFVERAKPHQALFACLSVYPGTEDFLELERQGVIDRRTYFTEDFLELKMSFDASEQDEAVLSDFFCRHKGLQTLARPSVAELRGVLERLGEPPSAHLDLGAALFHQGELDAAEQHVRRALALGYPLPGLGHNYLACIAAARGHQGRMRQELERGIEIDPQHAVLVKNREIVGQWLAHNPQASEPLPKLVSGHDFELLERLEQPTLPGPLPERYAQWAG